MRRDKNYQIKLMSALTKVWPGQEPEEDPSLRLFLRCCVGRHSALWRHIPAAVKEFSRGGKGGITGGAILPHQRDRSGSIHTPGKQPCGQQLPVHPAGNVSGSADGTGWRLCHIYTGTV